MFDVKKAMDYKIYKDFLLWFGHNEIMETSRVAKRDIRKGVHRKYSSGLRAKKID